MALFPTHSLPPQHPHACTAIQQGGLPGVGGDGGEAVLHAAAHKHLGAHGRQALDDLQVVPAGGESMEHEQKQG